MRGRWICLRWRANNRPGNAPEEHRKEVTLLTGPRLLTEL